MGWDQSYAGGSAARLVQNATPENAVVGCRVNSSASFNKALMAGLGIGYLWCFLGEEISALRKVNQDLPDSALGLWLIRHKDLANSQRLVTFSRYLQEAIQKHYQEKSLW